MTCHDDVAFARYLMFWVLWLKRDHTFLIETLSLLMYYRIQLVGILLCNKLM